LPKKASQLVRAKKLGKNVGAIDTLTTLWKRFNDVSTTFATRRNIKNDIQ